MKERIKAVRPLKEEVQNGFQYFNSTFDDGDYVFTTDEKHYLNAFMDYIQELESKLSEIQSAYNKPYAVMIFTDDHGNESIEVCTNDPQRYIDRVNSEINHDGDEVTYSLDDYASICVPLETFKINKK
tara:strand:- start:463 stop:846 length:384 start_codon:yes stop_codon:yes gene_type:complete